MRVVLGLVLVVAVVAVGAELVVPPRIEETIEARVAEEVPEATSVRADVDSFPVVARGLATGKVQRLAVSLRGVELPSVAVESVDVEALGIEIERRALLDGEVDLRRIDAGRLRAVVTEEALEDALPGDVVDLTLSPGRVEATVAGQTVGTDVEVSGGRVRFDLGPLPEVSVALPGPSFFPCTLEGEVTDGAVRLGCVLERVPEYLLRRLEGS
jgi:hypothetical protein